MKCLTYPLTLLITLSSVFAQAPAEPAAKAKPAPKKWDVVPEFTDEFNGTTLDMNKWSYGIHNWRGREPALNIPENIAVKDGFLNITMKAEQHPKMDGGYRDFTTGALSSLSRIRYGFFEVRAKMAKAQVASTFWLSHNAEEHWTEIDIYEIFGKGTKAARQMHMNVHAFKAPELKAHTESAMAFDLSFDPAADFHVYGLQWDAVSIKWLLDGKTVRQKPNIYWKYPLHVIFDLEVMNHWVGEPAAEDLPAVYQVDYVRTWQMNK